MTTDGLGSVRRALDILRVLGERPMRVQAVATAIGREKTQVSRSLKLLADEGFVERDPETLEYRLGWQLFALAGSAGDQRLIGDAPGVLRRLVLEVGEAAYLSVLQGAAALTVLTEHPARSRSLQAQDWIGRSTPLSCTAAGRTLMLGMRDEEAAALVGTYGDPLPGTGRGPRTIEEVLHRLRAEREQGYVAVIEEYEPGLVAVAAPVRSATGGVAASVNVSAPSFRLPPDALAPVIAAVRTAAATLSAT